MAMTTYASVDDYLAAQPAPARRVLVQMRRAIRKSIPGVEESVSYKIPTYRLDGRVVIYFAGWKEHVSIYPASPALVAALGAALAPYEVAKGTIRFPLARPVPVKLVERIARLRAAEVGRANAAKKAPAKAKARTVTGRRRP